MAAFNSFIDRLLCVPLNNEDYDQEVNIIKQIALNNGYKPIIIDRMIMKHKKRLENKIKNNKIHKKYLSANYTGLMPNILKSVFKNKGYIISFKTGNKLKDFSKLK